ncbi:MAG: ABC transporter permease [Planctomycetes bacterium]|nr:ABC transporter permease [Planctomycetota bacterium]
MGESLQFLFRRAGWYLATMWVVYTVSFFLMHAVPGGPFDAERNLPPEVRKNVEAQFNLNDPLPVQYFDHLTRALRGDFGASIKIPDFTVNEIIGQGFPISASLGLFAMVFAVCLGTTAGVVSAIRRESFVDFSFMVAATLGIAVPNFVLASLAIILFVFQIQLLPAAGWGSLKQIILPAICLGAPYAGYISRLTRTGMLEVLGRDYIRTAFAKGLSERRVVVRHALRGALVPVVSYLGPAVAGVMTGSLVVEKIFALPGMGSHFIEAAFQRDYPLALGVVVVYTALVLLMNTMVDFSYAILDPRVKLGEL